MHGDTAMKPKNVRTFAELFILRLCVSDGKTIF